MRRDDFTLDVSDVGWIDTDGEPRQPTVIIDFEGPTGKLRDRLAGSDGDLLAAEETDVAFRLLSDLDEPDADGVVSVTNRVTGEFILELNEDADDVLQFIRAAREYSKRGDGDSYRVYIRVDGEELVVYGKNTFLVYNADGELLRSHSLIPGGVEL